VLVSARPAKLKTYVEDCREITTHTTRDVGTHRRAWDTFTQKENEYGPRDTGVMGSGESGGLAYLLSTWSNDETFVELVQHAFDKADVSGGNGVVQLGSWRVDIWMREEAEARGINLAALTADRQNFTIPDPQIAPVPMTSGFANDPVCTATGNFVEQIADLVMPERLGALTWVRTYSSRLAVTGAHGHGWGTWADARCARRDDGTLAYTGPDGQQLDFATDRTNRSGGWRREPWISATPERLGDGVLLRWDWTSEHPGERWTFGPDGRPLSIWGPHTGVTTFEHDPAGRLIALTHEGGRSVFIHWDEAGERIERLVTSCAREVHYRYDEDGDLVEVEGANNPHRYLLDAGLIVEVWDADGVRLCHNVYDEERRVERQVSPFGRDTIFTYLPGRVTRVTDTEGGPESRWEHDRYGRLVGLVNDEGHRLSRSFDVQGRCVAVTSLDGTTVTNRFDAAGRVVGARHSTGVEEQFERDELDRVVRAQRSDGGYLAFEYSDEGAVPNRISGPEGWELVLDVADGVVRSITDADGVTMRFDVDADGSLVGVRDALGNTTTMTLHPSGAAETVVLPDGGEISVDRDDAGHPLVVTLPTGEVVQFRWTPAGRPTELIRPDGSTVTIEYASHGAEQAITEALGRVLELGHDQLGRLVGMSTSDGRKWEWSHTAMGFISAEHDPAGQVWLFDYDREGRVTGATDPTGGHATLRYDAAGHLAEHVNAVGATTRFEHDTTGRLRVTVDPEGARTAYQYDALGRPVTVETAAGGTVTRRYSPAGRLLEVRSGEGRGVHYTYDPAGRVTEVVDRVGGITRYEWDGLGRPVATTSPQGQVRRIGYDALGRIVTVTVNGFTSTMTYDGAGRITSRTDPLGATARFDYDAVGNLVAATDPLGRTVRYQWDDTDRCIAVVDPLGGTTRFDYDERRLLTSQRDPLDRTTRYRRDGAGRVVAWELPTGARVDFRRDAAGRVRDIAVDTRDVLVQELDGRGRPTLVHEPGANRTHTLAWTPDGRLARLDSEVAAMSWRYDTDGLLVERRAGERPTTLRYDPAGRLVGQDLDATFPIGFARDGDGRLVSITLPGLERDYVYDEAGRRREVIDRRDGNTARTRFSYDAAGRVTAVEADDVLTQYGYDAAGQLVSVDGGGERWTFAYDSAGRLVSESGPRGERRYHYDAAHCLTEIEGDEPATFTYDAAGCRTSQTGPAGTTGFGWDALSRLAFIERDGQRVDLDIDPFGSLVGVGDTTLEWDPTALAAELLAIDGRTVPFPTGDWRGSARPTDPWGASTGGADVGVGFRGELELGGLVWLRNRVYDPAARQFLSPDALAGVAGTAVASFPYHYGGNDPIGMIDPLGLQPVSMADFEQAKMQHTGPQWGNIVNVVAGVAGTLIVIATAGAATPLVALAVGAAIGAAGATSVQLAQQMGDQGRGFGDLDWGAIGRSAATGAAFSMAGAGMGSAASRLVIAPAIARYSLGPTGARLVSGGVQAANGATQGLTFTLAAEGLDLQGDGQFNPYVVPNMLIGAAGGGLGGSRLPMVNGTRTYVPPAPMTTVDRVVVGGGALVGTGTLTTLAVTSPDASQPPEIVPPQPVEPKTFPTPPAPTFGLDPSYSQPGSRPVYNPGPPGSEHCN